MSNLFIPMQFEATGAYQDLLHYYAKRDFNAQYIRSAEVIISPLMKSGFLVNDEDYRTVSEQCPLPPSDAENQYIPEQHFLLYIRAFERILRKRGILGGWDETEQSEHSGNSMVDPLEEYRI